MSLERGRRALNLEETDRIPQMEFIDHDELIKMLTGLSPEHPQAMPTVARKLDLDLIWSVCEMPITKGRVTNMGHAVYSEVDGKDDQVYCPFESVDDVINFDPVAEYGIPSFEETVEAFKKNYQEGVRNYPEAVFTGGRYHTLFSACVRTFGWEMFLIGAGTDYERFDRVLEGFYELTLAEIKAWVHSGIEVFICHDDIAWASGPPFHPDWYRKYIFPRYKKLWNVLKENGIKVLFCADGDYTIFVDDLAEAGADGFIMEPMTSLELFAEEYGKSKVLIGNMDCRILRTGTREEIYREVERCAKIGRECPGYFFNVGNHIPNDVPLEQVLIYLDIVRELGKR